MPTAELATEHADNAQTFFDVDDSALLDLVPIQTRENSEPEIIFEGSPTQQMQQAVEHVYRQPGLTVSRVSDKQSRKRSAHHIIDKENEPREKKNETFLSKNWPDVYTRSRQFQHNFTIINTIVKAGQDAAEALRGLEAFLSSKKGRPTHQHLNNMSKALGVLKALGSLLDHPTLSLSDKDFFTVISRKRIYEIYEGKMSRAHTHLLSFKLICVQAHITA